MRESVARQRAVFETALDALITIDHEGRVAEFNPAAERLFQYSREEVLGKTMADLIIPPSQRERHRRGLARFQSTGEAPILGKRIEVSAIRRDGTEFPAELAITRINQEGPAFFTGQLRDLTEQKQVQTEMLRSEERFRKLFDSNTIGIAIADLQGRTLEANDAYLSIIGYSREELLSGSVRWDAVTPPEHGAADRAAVEMLRRRGVAETWEKEYVRRDGTRVPVLIGVAMLEASENSCIAYVVDLSARRLLENQFRQAQKMEAVGRLAGGVAHDFNNLLTVILGYSDVVRDQLPAGHPLHEEVEEIRKAGERAAGLTRQLLAFSRTQVLIPEVLDLAEVVKDVDKMLRRLIGEDIDLRAISGPEIGLVKADRGQLQQVLMNLAVNSRDAMPGGGRLTIETRNIEFDGTSVAEHAATQQPGRYVLLAVSDTGAGMDADTKTHLFEPFFTTKEKGKGPGRGLSTVYGIVKQSGGFVWVDSEPGEGTAFKIYLPRVEDGEVLPPPAVPPPKSTRGAETILLLEDEEGLRRLARDVLRKQGYTVLETSGWQAAVEIAARHPGSIHLVLADVVMPEMGGPEVVTRVSALRPGIRVLYMSGYTSDAAVHRGLRETRLALLQKPFTPGDLARRVREVLDA